MCRDILKGNKWNGRHNFYTYTVFIYFLYVLFCKWDHWPVSPAVKLVATGLRGCIHSQFGIQPFSGSRACLRSLSWLASVRCGVASSTANWVAKDNYTPHDSWHTADSSSISCTHTPELNKACTILLSNRCVLRWCTVTQCSFWLSVIGVHHSPLSYLEALGAAY